MTLTARIATAIIRTIGRTLRFRFLFDDPDTVPQRMKRRAIYVFWHEMLLLPVYANGSQVTPVVSRSKDGTLIDEVIRNLGGHTIRGSTDHGGRSHGGRTALREMLRHGRDSHLGVPVDGSIGPRRRTISPGVAWVASRGRMPVIPMGIATKRYLSVGPHGRPINLPLLFSRAWFVVGKPLDVPPRLDKSQTRAFMQRVQAAMDDVQARAEHLASNGHTAAGAMTLSDLKAL
ncbi:MAG: DUF374 domain-containing protein [Phycisphaerae bacterium]|nr:DUF374 domain-containing protein [Phycisphaerae bacterium]